MLMLTETTQVYSEVRYFKRKNARVLKLEKFERAEQNIKKKRNIKKQHMVCFSLSLSFPNTVPEEYL